MSAERMHDEWNTHLPTHISKKVRNMGDKKNIPRNFWKKKVPMQRIENLIRRTLLEAGR
jgi:hypothetical protein